MIARLVAQNVRRSARTLLLASLGIVIGISAFTFFLSLREGVRSRVLNAIFPIDRFEVVPNAIGGRKAKKDASPVDVEALKRGEIPAATDSTPRRVVGIDDDTLVRLTSHPDVLALVPKQRVDVPVKALLDIPILRMFGVEPFPLDLPVEGVPAAALADETYGARFVELPEDPAAMAAALAQPVPVVLSPFAVEMYDGTFAPVLGLPSFGRMIERIGSVEVLFSLLNIEIVIGDGVIRAPLPPPHIRQRIQVIGMSDKAMRLGASVPMSYAKRWNARLGPEATRRYTSVIVIARSKEAVGRIASFVTGPLELAIDDGDADKYAFILDVVSALLVLIAFIIMATAAINIGHVFFLLVAERRREIGVLRAVGASRSDVTQMVLGEAALLGLFGGVVGVALALLGTLVANVIARTYLPDFPFKPTSFFVFRWWIVAGGLILAIAFCMIGALFPARRAARMDPAAALAKG